LTQLYIFNNTDISLLRLYCHFYFQP